MSNEARPVPTGPGWWWRDDVIVYVEEGSRGLLFYEDFSERWVAVEDDGRWVCPVLTSAEADALRERAERAEADFDRERDDHARTIAERDEAQRDAGCRQYELDRYREAVGRLRGLAELLLAGDTTEADRRLAEDVLATTTDEAIRGYAEPPVPDERILKEKE